MEDILDHIFALAVICIAASAVMLTIVLTMRLLGVRS